MSFQKALQAFTNELLDLLWIPEAAAAFQPEQARLLDAVAAGSCLPADDLPPCRRRCLAVGGKVARHRPQVFLVATEVWLAACLDFATVV